MFAPCVASEYVCRWARALLLGVVGAIAVQPVVGWAQPGAPAASASSPATPPSADQPPVPLTFTARVTRVFDGDTLWVRPLTGGRYRKLRLDGLDAPEMCQNGGPAARDALASRVLDRVVTVHVRAHDTYDRGLAQVLMGGEDVAAALVRNGHAWSSRWRQHLGPYAAEEALARTERRGVFETEAAENPRDFRRRHGPCPLP